MISGIRSRDDVGDPPRKLSNRANENIQDGKIILIEGEKKDDASENH